MEEIVVPAHPDQLETVQDFVCRHMAAAGLPVQEQARALLAVEEIFVNIAHYAYHPEQGEATVRCAVGSEILMEFLDEGKPFNPLAHAEPDTSLPAEERAIGGLGIYLIKRLMDQVEYRYENGKNILVMRMSTGAAPDA